MLGAGGVMLRGGDSLHLKTYPDSMAAHRLKTHLAAASVNNLQATDVLQHAKPQILNSKLLTQKDPNPNP